MEFLRICVSEHFTNVVISIKASSTLVMVNTVRLLVLQMEAEGMKFPLHLGVTEAGDGEDGRIKSAAGIGTLLLEGIGDTIRVSLSEDPEAEIPVAKKLLSYIQEKAATVASIDYPASALADLADVCSPAITDFQTPVVIADFSQTKTYDIPSDLTPDFLYLGTYTNFPYPKGQKIIVDFSAFSSQENEFPLFTASEKEAWLSCKTALQFLSLDDSQLDTEFITALKQKPQTVILLSGSAVNRPYDQKAGIFKLAEAAIKNPVIIRQQYAENDLESFQIKSSVDCGSFFLDRLAHGIFIDNTGTALSPAEINSCSFGILQATGRRISKTEYISCPSCGRTLFDLQATL
jgi:(E)-4-hydroxy-3-methylbut-2-enyl-diphosphate synthase